MTEPDPHYTNATYPDVEMKLERARLPAHVEQYYQIKRRALIMEVKAIERLLGIDKENGNL